MNPIQLSWRSVTDRPLKMLLSVMLFALGVGLISFILLMDKQIQENFERNLAEVDLVIGAKGSPLQMILSSMYHIDAPTGNISLKEIRPFLNPRHPLIEEALPLSMGDSYRGYRIVGTDHKILDWYDAQLSEGEIWKYNFEVTVGSTVAQSLSIRIGDTFKSSHGLVDDENLEHDDAESFVVKGILKPTGTVVDQLILTTSQSFWLVHDHDHEEEVEEVEDDDHDHEGHDHNEEHNHEEHAHDNHDHDDHGDDHDHDGHDHGHDHHEDHVHAAEPLPLIQEADDKEITSLLLRFKGRSFQALNMQRSINENTDMQAATPAIEINRLFSMMSSAEQALRILALLIIIVSAISVFISLYSSLNERRYELALMRSMGAGPSKVFSLITLEGVILALIGAIVGLILSHGLLFFFADHLREAYRYNFSAGRFLREELYLVLAALVIGFIAAVIPAYQASKTDIAETLTAR